MCLTVKTCLYTRGTVAEYVVIFNSLQALYTYICHHDIVCNYWMLPTVAISNILLYSLHLIVYRVYLDRGYEIPEEVVSM